MHLSIYLSIPLSIIFFVLHEGIICARDVCGINTTAFRALRVVSPWPRRTVTVGYIISCSKPCWGMLWRVMLCNGYVRMPNVYCRYGYHSWKPIRAVYTANHLCNHLHCWWPFDLMMRKVTIRLVGNWEKCPGAFSDNFLKHLLIN